MAINHGLSLYTNLENYLGYNQTGSWRSPALKLWGDSQGPVQAVSS